MENKLEILAEKDIQQKYSRNGIYSDPKSAGRLPGADPESYADNILQIKLQLLDKYAKANYSVLDIGSGNGTHALYILKKVKDVTGIDLSPYLVAYSKKQAIKKKVKKVKYIQANVKQLPFKANSFHLVYSFSSLYYVPNIQKAIAEISRVLKPGGIAILDMGNYYSLNYLSCLYHPELAKLYVLPVSNLKQEFNKNNLQVKEDRSFQILPLWSDRPWWLYPLLHPAWSRIMTKKWNNRLVDETISSLPGFKNLAFRHLYVLKKISI